MMCVVLGSYKCHEVKITLQTAHDQGACQKREETKKVYLMLLLLIGNIHACSLVGVLQQRELMLSVIALVCVSAV